MSLNRRRISVRATVIGIGTAITHWHHRHYRPYYGSYGYHAPRQYGYYGPRYYGGGPGITFSFGSGGHRGWY